MARRAVALISIGIVLLGSALVTSCGTTYSITTVTGILGSGQHFMAKVPIGAPPMRGVIFFHGGFQDESITADPNINAITDAIAEAGFPVISGDDGGTLWGNDVSRAKTDELVSYLQSSTGLNAAPGQVALFGLSQGGENALSWTSIHLSSVACFLGIAPVSSLQQVYDEGFSSSIDAAYGSLIVNGKVPITYDPISLAYGGHFAGLAFRAYSGTADSTVTNASVDALGTLIGSTATVINVTGADHTTIESSVPPSDAAAFLQFGCPPAS
jgi:pimeloyl-ACP methyl ester carboxylesterase